MDEEKLQTLGEFGLIRRIRQQAGSAEHLLLGIGDDCAIQRQDESWELLTSTDLLIEGVHFKREWTSMEELGRKSAAVNISDIAAMGGRPKSLYLGIASPGDVPVAELESFSRGFLAEVSAYDAVLAGGDTCRSPGPLMISVTVQGEVEAGRAIRRDGARVGDAIYVSGTLGDSALALRYLLAGEQPNRYLLARHNTPTARVALGRRLVQEQLASAMLDVSDGILSDLGHILEASGVGAELKLEALPLSDEFRSALEKDKSLFDLALAGGEDYELLLTSPIQNLSEKAFSSVDLTKIGQVCAHSGVRVKNPDGSLYNCARGGFDHFG